MTPVAANVQSMKPGISPEEWKIRVDLAAAFRLAAMQGWDELLFAHLSARVPGEANHFLMHPAHMLFEEVTASNLHKLDENCNHVMPSDELPHKFAFPFHKGIYDAFPAAQCVMHLHTKAVTAVAMQDQGLIPGNQYAMWLGPDRLSQLRRPGFDAGGRRAAGEEFRREPSRAAEGARLRAVGPLGPEPTCWPSCSTAPARCRSRPWPAASSPTCRRRRCSTSRPAGQDHYRRQSAVQSGDLADAAAQARPRCSDTRPDDRPARVRSAPA